MKTLKGWITTTCLATVLMVCTLTANAGIIVGGRTGGEDVCKEPTEGVKGGIIVGGLGGIIVGGFTGIIVGGLTGIIVGGAIDPPPVNCGIIVGG
jgi:hypothetical protein